MTQNTFTDRKGRTWLVDLDIRIAREVDKSDFSTITDVKFSILTPNQELYKLILGKPSLTMAVIWAMVRHQAKGFHRAWTEMPEDSQEEITARWDRRESIHSGDVIYAGSYFPVDPSDPEEAELEFVSGINGPVIDEARKALVEAFATFFPDHRTALSVILRQFEKMRQKVNEAILKEEPELERLMEEEMEDGIKNLRKQMREESSSRRRNSPGLTSSASPAT